jgi:hypothetical protein
MVGIGEKRGRLLSFLFYLHTCFVIFFTSDKGQAHYNK